MKKRFLAAVVVAAMVTSMTACSNDKTDVNGTESVQTTENGTEATALTEAELAEKYSFLTYSGKNSNEIELNIDEIVTALPDYNNFEYELEAGYEVSESNINDYFAYVLSQYGADSYKEITDRDVVEENDYVKLDYTGYKDDVAFDGGAATDVLIDVANNMQVGASYGFIDGFTSGIPGAKVGDTIKCPVTFPENYGNEDLNGQEVIFEFKIKAIYSHDAKTLDDVSDEEVNELFGSSGFTTNAALKDQLVKDLEYNLQSAVIDKLSDDLVSGATVNIPADYIDARCAEMLAQAKLQYSTDTQTLEELVVASGMTYDDYLDSLQTAVKEQVTLEVIAMKIAKEENLDVDDTEFEERVNEVVTANSESFASADDLYKYFGGDNLELGKATFRNQIVLDKITKELAGRANVKFASSSSDETSAEEATAEEATGEEATTEEATTEQTATE